MALRARAAEVVAAELTRLEQRRPDLDPEVREELRRTVNRVVDKLLHAPTVRVKELAGVAEPADYAAALRDLFDLDPHDVAVGLDRPAGRGHRHRRRPMSAVARDLERGAACGSAPGAAPLALAQAQLVADALAPPAGADGRAGPDHDRTATRPAARR